MLKVQAALTVLLTVAAAPVLAQGRVTGSVKDQDGHPVRGASITAENAYVAPSTFTAITDGKGQFALLGLRGGDWTFTIKAPGFETRSSRLPIKALGANAPVDVRLLPALDSTPLPLAGLDVAAIQRRLDAAAALEAAARIDEAIGAYRDILAHIPSLTTVHLQLGYLFERKHDITTAIAEYQAVLSADTDNRKARAALDRLSRQ